MDSKRRPKLSKNGAVKRAKPSRTRATAPDIAAPDVIAPDVAAPDAVEDARAEDRTEYADETVPADVAIVAESAESEDESSSDKSAETDAEIDAELDIEAAKPTATDAETTGAEATVPDAEEAKPATADASISEQEPDADTGAVAGEDSDADTATDIEADTGVARDATEVADAQVTARSPLVMNAVKIRGRPGGVAIEIGEGEWAELLAVLRERLEIAEGFFRGGRVVLDVGDRAVAEAELRAAFDVLIDFEMQMAVVRSSAETTLDAAAILGVTSTTSELDDPLRGVVEVQVEEESVREPTAYYVHQGNLRSGQVLERTESVIVIGDVNPGAQVVSQGDVLIYGRLRGSVHAGAGGDQQAMVTALEFAPTQLRIAAFTSVPPEDKKQSVGLRFWKKESDEQEAEYAYIADGRIYVEPWNAAKPGSMTSRRRR